MAEPVDTTKPNTHFLDLAKAEIVHGPDVVADKVSGAMKDADRFGLSSVKPPLSEALKKTRQAGTSVEAAEEETDEQNALTGFPAEVDEEAGSAERLMPNDAARPT